MLKGLTTLFRSMTPERQQFLNSIQAAIVSGKFKVGQGFSHFGSSSTEPRFQNIYFTIPNFNNKRNQSLSVMIENCLFPDKGEESTLRVNDSEYNLESLITSDVRSMIKIAFSQRKYHQDQIEINTIHQALNSNPDSYLALSLVK